MIPVLFDTNIYGKVVADPNKAEVIRRIGTSRLSVLNFSLIRQELRRTAKGKTHRRTAKLRPLLLTTYDQIVIANAIGISREVAHLADAYHVEYRQLRGHVGKKKIINDLRIIACASLHQCDLVASDDSHMMKTSKVLTACHVVNARRGLKSPRFITYDGLKRLINAL